MKYNLLWSSVVAASAFLAVAPASAFVLSNQSNITTSVGTGFNGADISVRPPSAFVNGFEANSTNTLNTPASRAATSFSVSAEGNFVSAVTIFAYSISDTYPASPTSPFTGISVNIWNGAPGAVGSTLLYSSSTMSDTQWTGIYRVSSTATLSNRRPVMEVTAGFGDVFLAAGTYWADWAITGITAPGDGTSIFIPPLMNGDGTLFVGESYGFNTASAPGAWSQLYDLDTAVGLPLRVVGTQIPEPLTSLGLLLVSGTGMILRLRRP